MSEIVNGAPAAGALSAAGPAVGADSLFRCLAWIGAFHGDSRSVGAWQHGVAAPRGPGGSVRALLQAAHFAGYSATLVQREGSTLADYVLPAIALLSDGSAAVLIRRDASGRYEVALPEGEDTLLPCVMEAQDFLARCSGHFILVKPPYRHDPRAGEAERAPAAHWFWGTLWRFRRAYGHVALAAVMVNVLTLAGVFFTMNVYDRVIPTQAYPTLWTLAIGTFIAMSFEFASRMLRSAMVDGAGKKVDLLLGAALFRQAMNLRLEMRPASAGAFANQLREFESLREFTTSSTVAALSDLPFALLFLAVVAAIAGPLAWVPAGAVLLVLACGLAVQWPLARLMKENLRQASLKQGLLVETLEGIETLKAVNGQAHMQRLWEDYSAVSAQGSMRSRLLTSLALNLVTYVQQVAGVAMVVWGVYRIHEGLLSMGALVSGVMLARQSIVPVSQAVGLALRFQMAKASYRSLNALMAQPVDRTEGRRYLARPAFQGGLRLEGVDFAYPGQKQPALAGINLEIRPGERVAILGRIGCGKSTLLRLLSGLYQPVRGSVLADGIDLQQTDPTDVHRNIGLVVQDTRLFYGTLRDNLTLGVGEVAPERLLAACQVAGLEGLVRRHPAGLDLPLGENGAGLSGGQRQQVALARTLLSQPPVLLMDEPTSAMDAQTEQAFIDRLGPLVAQRTLVIATHRFSLLSLVDRIIVLDAGRVVADGPRNTILKALQRESAPAAGAAVVPA